MTKVSVSISDWEIPSRLEQIDEVLKNMTHLVATANRLLSEVKQAQENLADTYKNAVKTER